MSDKTVKGKQYHSKIPKPKVFFFFFKTNHLLTKAIFNKCWHYLFRKIRNNKSRKNSMKSTMKATADYVGQWKVDYRRLAVFVNESG